MPKYICGKCKKDVVAWIHTQEYGITCDDCFDKLQNGD